ncbi:amidohydrolase [Aquibacillus rhizosphaerae]|uniref:Amidohydrolase n=1 Tax=Aquibacillus rhizosphaerae TaxID=3051431 RepID=A0ABT7L9U0_9BACI|nr:amidohydrolase [Aquibacillus sp. LR5S19]MDL4841341.1 amidohydrolase [Aquibacillus sp. LR5S19]
MGVLWYGGNIYTMKSIGNTVDSVFIEDGIIVDTGDYHILKQNYGNKISEIKNLNGKTMFPGFVDSHLHIIGHGEKIAHLDLSLMTSPEQVAEALRSRVDNLHEGEWLIGEGWNENQWEDPRILHKDELDSICPNNPMLLTRVCRHAILANTHAMEKAGVNDRTKDPQGGKIVRNEEGQATGYFLDTAQEIIKKVVPDISIDKLTKLVGTSIDELLELGLVGGHSEDLAYYGGFNKTLAAFYNAINKENRRFRAHLLVHHEVVDDMIASEISFSEQNEYIELGAMKIFSDGALGGRTAWLSEPYEDDRDNYGIPIHSIEVLEDLVKKARLHGLPIAVHAIGDQAAWTVAKLIQKYPLNNGRRDRIIHAQVMNKQLLELLKSIDVVLDIQPTFVASDFPWIIDRLGEKRVQDAYPWKTYLQHGIPCAAGSDAPIEDVNPLHGIEAAVLRRSNIDGNIYNEKQQLSVYEAISLYTKGSAYVIGREHNRGQIDKGFLADFTILDVDLFQIPPEKIRTAKVEMTVVDGEIAYNRE